MATLAARISALAGAVRDKFNTVTPRLLPAGGSAGQVLAKASGTDHDAEWTTLPLWLIDSLAGKPADGLRWIVASAPKDFQVTAETCAAVALTPAAAQVVATLKKRTRTGTETAVGTFTWEAGTTVAAIAISSGAIAAGEILLIEWPATADAALADIAVQIGNSIIAAASPPVILAIMTGQSNMPGRNANDGLNVNRANKFALVADDYEANYLSVIGDTSILYTPEHLDRTGPDDQILDDLAMANPDKIVVGVSCGVGGVGFANPGNGFFPGADAASSGANYNDMLDMAAAAFDWARATYPGCAIEPRLYIQHGENESSGTARATVAAKMQDYIGHARARLAAATGEDAFLTMEAAIGLMCGENWHPAMTGNPQAAWQDVVAGFVDAALNTPGACIVASDVTTAAGDLLHWQPAAQARLQGSRHVLAPARTDLPGLTTNAQQGNLLGQQLAIEIRHDGEDDPAHLCTGHITGGADAALFEIDDPYHPATFPHVIWAGDGTGPENVGTYAVEVSLRNSAGVYGAPLAIAVEVAEQQAVPVVAEFTYMNAATPTNYGNFAVADVPVKVGLNLFLWFAGSGVNKDASFAMTVNGNPCFKVAGNSAGNGNTQLWGYVSAIETTVTLGATWSAHEFDGSLLYAFAVSGVDPAPVSTDISPWNNTAGITTLSTASLTVPEGGLAILLGASASASLTAAGDSQLLDRRQVGAGTTYAIGLSRETTGSIQFNITNGSWRTYAAVSFAPPA